MAVDFGVERPFIYTYPYTKLFYPPALFLVFVGS